jgi:hypothetical protein
MEFDDLDEYLEDEDLEDEIEESFYDGDFEFDEFGNRI